MDCSSAPKSNIKSNTTTFIQADPSNFRAVVQRFTGSAHEPPTSRKLPVAHPASRSDGTVPRRPAIFKLHERRRTKKKLELKLNNNGGGTGSPSGSRQRNYPVQISPVSPLDPLLKRGSPRSPGEEAAAAAEEEKEGAIAEKGFYFHPNPFSTPRRSDPPELLTLFPLHSPTYNNNNNVIVDYN